MCLRGTLGDIPLQILPRSARVERDQLVMHWTHDIHGYTADHQSVFTAEQLRSMRSKPRIAGDRSKRTLWDKKRFSETGNWTTFEDYMNNPTSFTRAIRALHQHGLIFVTNIPEDERAIDRIAQRIGPLRNTFYGLTWDVRSKQDAKNVAYTNEDLGFHMDLLYMKDPPGYQLLHTLKNSCEGGESQFADSIYAALRLQQADMSHFETLSSYPVDFAYVNDGHSYSQARNTVVLDKSGQILNVNWSPPFQDLVGWGSRFHLMTDDQNGTASHKQRDPGDGQKKQAGLRSFVVAAAKFAEQMEREDMVYELKTAPGTCAVFDNRRVVHSRKAFNTGSGQRWLKGAYISKDDFLSTVAALEPTPAWDMDADRY